MHITTWNVNGIRAIINKGFNDSVSKIDPDVLCLQEVKASRDQVPENFLQFRDINIEWNAAKRPGYSGVATISRSHIQTNHQCGIGLDEYDNESRVIQTKLDGFTLLNVYFPSGQRDYGRVEFKLAFYKSLLEKLSQRMESGEEFIVTGDFNTAHKEIDLANPKSNQKTSGFLPEERAMIDRYLDNGFNDAFRILYPDKVKYTWWTYISGARARNVGWRLDYFLVTDNLVSRVKDVIIHDDILGSDHCPVSLIID